MRTAKVYVGGELRAHSDNEGNYQLSNMAVGKYTIQVGGCWPCDNHVTVVIVTCSSCDRPTNSCDVTLPNVNIGVFNMLLLR